MLELIEIQILFYEGLLREWDKTRHEGRDPVEYRYWCNYQLGFLYYLKENLNKVN